MTKFDLATKAAEILRASDIRKPVRIKKSTFYISDDEGNKAAFDIKGQHKDVIYTIDDIIKIIDALVEATCDALKSGEEIVIKGFGSLNLDIQGAHKVVHPVTKETYTIPAHFTPKFKSGDNLRLAAKVYELTHPVENNKAENTKDGEVNGD